MFKSIVRSLADLQASLGGCWSTKTRTRIIGNVKFGKNVFIDDDVLIEASKKVTVEDNVIVGPRVLVLNTAYDLDAQKYLDDVQISSGVYIGPGAIICPGVRIGENSAISPGAVVFSNVPAGKIVSGNPAVIVGNIDKRIAPPLKRKRKTIFSSSIFDRFDRWVFKERLGFRGGVLSLEENKMRTYEPPRKKIKIGYDVLVEGEGDILVGENVSIGHRVTICTTEHRMERSPIGSSSRVYPTIIEDYGKIESGSIILPGTRIGKKAVVKAGSIVTKSVPPNSEVRGNPAKTKNDEESHHRKSDPLITRDFANLPDEETRKFVEILHLYKSYIEKTYNVKSRKGEIVFINRDVFLRSPKQVAFKGQALIAPRTIISPNYCWEGPTDFENISIGDDVWIGAGAIVLSGVTLGKGVIVGAGSVVKNDVPENMIVLGNPAVPIKQRKVDEEVNLRELLIQFEARSSFSSSLVNSMKVGLLRLICR